jgi:hypothetical protein
MGMTNLQILLFVLEFSNEVIPRLRVFQRFGFAHKRRKKTPLFDSFLIS